MTTEGIEGAERCCLGHGTLVSIRLGRGQALSHALGLGRGGKREDDAPAPLLQFAFVHGCPGQCAFCSQAGTDLRALPVDQGVDALIETRDRVGCSDFTFVNSQINASKSYANAFCDELIARGANLRWSDSVNCRLLDEGLLDKMRRAGAIRLVFGVETPDARMLRYVRKGTTLDRIERMLRHADALGSWARRCLDSAATGRPSPSGMGVTGPWTPGSCGSSTQLGVHWSAVPTGSSARARPGHRNVHDQCPEDGFHPSMMAVRWAWFAHASCMALFA